MITRPETIDANRASVNIDYTRPLSCLRVFCSSSYFLYCFQEIKFQCHSKDSLPHLSNSVETMGPQLKLIVTTKQKKRAKMVPNSPLAPLAPTLRLLRRLGLCPLKLGSPVQGWECAASASAWLSAALAGSALALFLPFGDAGDALKVLLSLQERLGSNSRGAPRLVTMCASNKKH